MATPANRGLYRRAARSDQASPWFGVKFGRVAEGGADIYPRLSPTCEWDVAAGHAVVTAAGGKITDSKGADLCFGAGPRGLSGSGIHRLGRPGGRPVNSSTTFRQGRPLAVSAPGDALRIGRKGRAVLFAAEQIQPFARRSATTARVRRRPCPRYIDRIVAAEPGSVDIRMGEKHRPVGLVAEAPDRTACRGLNRASPWAGSASVK
jgi:hypothetical protein